MRLFSQVYFSSLAFVLFSMALLTTVLSYRGSQYSLAQLRNEQRLLAVTAASQVEAGYHENTWPFGMLWAMTKEPQFAFWQILDGDGQSVLSSGSVAPLPPSTDRLKAPSWTVSAPPAADHVEEWVVPLAVGNSPSPWLFRLGFTTSGVREQVWRNIFTNVVLAAVIALLLVGLSFVFTRRLLGPLRTLTDAALELERGNLAVSLPSEKNDELGHLVRAFGSMAASIQQRDGAIQDHLESLRTAHDDMELREARLRSIIDHAADGIVTANDQGAIEVYNPSAERIFGFSREEIVGQNMSRLLAEGYAIDPAGELVDRTSGQPVALGRSAEIGARRKDGTLFPLQIALSDVYAGGTLKLRTAIVRDVSDRRRAEAERKEMHARLVQASRQAGMAEVATSVLHNVGNVLNSVNVSATLLSDALRHSKVGGVGRASSLMQAHADDLGAYLTQDSSGKLLPSYLAELARALDHERAVALKELTSLLANIEHIKAVVSQQQTYAGAGAKVAEDLELAELCEDALKICGAGLDGHRIVIDRQYGSLPTARIDRHKVLQVLINLFSNAKHALVAARTDERRLVVRTGLGADGLAFVHVADNGVGIAQENLLRIFNHGFTTKKDGHGFGLHSSALAASQLGGGLSVTSEGLGRGATFVLRVPLQPAASPAIEEHGYERAS